MKTKAQSAYDSGIASIANRQLEQGRKYKQQLVGIKSDVKEFETLPGRLSQVYSSIRTTSKDPEANTQAEDLHRKGQEYVNSVDIASLKTVLNSLESLDVTLRQKHTLRIVSRPGVWSYTFRDYTDKNGRRQSGAYIIIEAIPDNGGRALSRQITNEEDGHVYSVTMWAERVPDAVLEAVKKDKDADGRVDNNIFAEKEVGYLNEVVKFPGVSQRTGQITSW